MPSISVRRQSDDGQDLADQRKDPADMVARGELGHHTAVLGVHLDLRVQRLAEEAMARCGRAGLAGIGQPVERDPGFVAGRLDP